MKGLLSPSPWPSATAVSAPVLITASDTICVPSLIPPVISVTIPLEIPMLTGCAVNVSPSRVQFQVRIVGGNDYFIRNYRSGGSGAA